MDMELLGKVGIPTCALCTLSAPCRAVHHQRHLLCGPVAGLASTACGCDVPAQHASSCARLLFSTAASPGLNHLPQIPLNISIREQSDAGAPIVAVEPDSAAAQVRSSVGGREDGRDQGRRRSSVAAFGAGYAGAGAGAGAGSCFMAWAHLPEVPRAISRLPHRLLQAYVSVAERVWAKLQQSAGGEGGEQARGPPKIVFE